MEEGLSVEMMMLSVVAMVALAGAAVVVAIAAMVVVSAVRVHQRGCHHLSSLQARQEDLSQVNLPARMVLEKLERD